MLVNRRMDANLLEYKWSKGSEMILLKAEMRARCVGYRIYMVAFSIMTYVRRVEIALQPKIGGAFESE